ncbi:hypothetical protein [Streptomyces sp. NBC_00525]|uniref:hypothetical protein n=1 Tax=Streptomyces sp. NBC_00525 TaxID=2903660 RepID=UPI002E81A16D|nr:hypothetical protein [Streptomyces sp. NBC_00525]WUC94152.1 hypothetical protein OG710_11295 [Streptomyces sp. NBC_00525]
MSELWAHTLTWADVALARHPFQMDDDVAEELASLVARLLPSADLVRKDRWHSLDPVTEFLAGVRPMGLRNWSVSEGGVGGWVHDAEGLPIWQCCSES